MELDAELTVTLHIQTVDQLKAIKTIKGKISDIGRMKAEEQKKISEEAKGRERTGAKRRERCAN